MPPTPAAVGNPSAPEAPPASSAPPSSSASSPAPPLASPALLAAPASDSPASQAAPEPASPSPQAEGARAAGRVVYLDHHATTPVDPRVLDAMLPWFGERYGNPSSASHRLGWQAEAAVELAREQIAAGIGAAEAAEIVFTSGATESDNLALCGALAAIGGGGLVTVATEHPAVLDTCAALAKRGVRVQVLPVDERGLVDPERLAAAIDKETVLVSVMAANSEIGAVPPLAEIGGICAERGVLFHCDAAQAVGKMPLDVEALGIDLLSFSAHKLYGPKGVGALYLRRRARAGVRRPRLEPLLFGGGQERGLRPGTLPVPLVVGFARAVALALETMDEERARIGALQGLFWSLLEQQVGGVFLNGPAFGEERLPGNLNVSIQGVRADAMLPRLEDLALSTGSACASASPAPSHVLKACGFDDARIQGALRFGLGRFTDEAELRYAAGRLAEVVSEARAAGA